MRSGQSITVTRLSLTRYRELREIRLFLEGLATEKAVSLLTAADLKKLKKLHEGLVRAEKDGDSEAATLTNFNFHFLIYRASQAEDLVSLLETIWLRNGPLLKFLYPHARPTYPGRHQHLILMEALQDRDPVAARQAIQDDIIEGGALLVQLLSKIESGKAVVTEDADGNMRLELLAPAS
jgi:DNA-binding GntR family transcriptional regulator